MRAPLTDAEQQAVNESAARVKARIMRPREPFVQPAQAPPQPLRPALAPHWATSARAGATGATTSHSGGPTATTSAATPR